MRVLRWIAGLAVYAVCVAAGAATGGVPDTIEQRVAACTSCHGDHGRGSRDGTAGPRIAGQPAAYLALQLRYFQNGQRKDDAMRYITQPLTPGYAKEIAAYFASQTMADDAGKSSVPAGELAERGAQVVLKGDPSRGVPPCASCHGVRLAGREPLIPGLTQLSTTYLKAQFAQWRSHARAADRPYCMSVVANRMSEAEIDAAVQWLADRRPGDVPSTETAGSHEPPLPEWCVMDEAGPGL